MPRSGFLEPSVARGAAGRADSQINVVCRGPVNGDVITLRAIDVLLSVRC
ncbi:hypothetical protein CA13_00580 [Planctomycetes bacterium CA13]|uniref:Uncharacterized protein n=1 Tax=Novipirellula herctigrandis TaxID=2527986 RepID=A0A5C5YUE8_9BACT|nr:hypothetical protein CA13_00580 [Planctomycetes bacterium CA13]